MCRVRPGRCLLSEPLRSVRAYTVNFVAGLGLEPMSPASEGSVFSALRGCLHADDSTDFLAASPCF